MLEQINYHGSAVEGKTITKAVLDYDSVRIIFTDGTFVNAELRHESYEDSGGIYHTAIEVKSNLSGGTTNPYEADKLLKQGIITQAEYNAFAAEYKVQDDANKKRREDRDRLEFERLKKRFGG